MASWPQEQAAADDADLIVRCARGDAQAFGELYDRYVDQVYRRAYYFLRDRAQAEELSTETFLQAWSEARRRPRRDVPVLLWLLGIAHRLLLARLGGPAGGAHLPGGEEAVAAAHPPERNSHQEDVTRAILRLRPLEQQVLLLRFVDGLGYEEIARLLGRKLSEVHSLQYRALANLSRILSSSISRQE